MEVGELVCNGGRLAEAEASAVAESIVRLGLSCFTLSSPSPLPSPAVSFCRSEVSFGDELSGLRAMGALKLGLGFPGVAKELLITSGASLLESTCC